MSENHHSPPPTTVPFPPAGPLIPSSTDIIAASSRLSTGPITAPSPVFRNYTPTHLTPISIDGGEAVRKSSRLKKEEVYDFNAPVVLHESIEDQDLAGDEVLLAFGFALCDNDTMWYHPHAQFECQAKEELCCKWRRGTILRCCITHEITTTDETGEPVIDLDPLASLYHPKCVNGNCKWGVKPQHVMRLEKGQLVTCELSSGQLFALRTRAKGKWYGPCQDRYPRGITSKPFSNDPTPGLVKKRNLALSNTPSSAITDQPPGRNPPPISPDSLPPSPAKSTAITCGKRKRNKAGPSRRRSRPKPEPITSPDTADTPETDPDQSRDDEGFEADVTDGSVLKDHFIVSKRHYHMLEAKIKSLDTSFNHAAALYNGAEQDADHQKSLAQQWQAGLKQTTDRLAASEKKIGELEKLQGTLKSEVEAATKEVESQKGLAKEWKDAATIAVRVLAAEKHKVRDLEEREKAAVIERTALQENKAALEKENAELKVEVVAEKAKVEEVVSSGRRLFEGFGSK